MMQAKFKLLCILCLFSLTCPIKGHAESRILIDSDWRFALADIEGAETAGFNDTRWRKLHLPHDWSIEGDVSPANPSGNDGGYYPTGVGWYRKSLQIPPSYKNRKVYLYFEGVYMNSAVYINGVHAGGHPYGYSSFFCDITEYLKVGGKNVIAVRVDNAAQKNCRWYSGSGIYRHVWLISYPLKHIAPWGVFVTTPRVNARSATVKVSTVVRNDDSHVANMTVKTRIPGHEPVASAIVVPAGDSLVVAQEVQVAEPRLWSPEHPSLYKAEVELYENGSLIDSFVQPFGIRSIEYSSKGFYLNGRQMKLNGGCVHHDNGIIGAASFDRAEIRKAELLKKAGFNAVRTAHNIPSEAFLNACDSIGLLVIDEAFDGWRMEKTPHDYSTLFDRWWKQDIRAMVLRDRNHPSVFCWSIGNEVIERKKIEVVTTAKQLAACVRHYDPDRPVTSALASWDSDWEIYDPLAAEMDITGYNYMLHKAQSDHERVPERVMMQTESYPRDAFRNWSMVNDNDYILGDFVWTAIDYLGESGIGRYWYEGDVKGEHYEHPLYPWHASYCGDLDLIGCRKPISHYREILYGDKEKLYMAVREPDGYNGHIKTGLWAVWPTWDSWNWPGHEGKNIEVVVYSRYPKVRLYLDDKMVGEQLTGLQQEFKAVFTIPYAPGTLRADGVGADGAVKESQILPTAGDVSGIRLSADRMQIKPDVQDLAYIMVELTDNHGRVVPNAEKRLTFEISGCGEILAVGNANIKDTNPYKSNTCKTWKGRALVIVRSSGKNGKIKLTARSEGMAPSSVEIIAKTNY